MQGDKPEENPPADPFAEKPAGGSGGLDQPPPADKPLAGTPLSKTLYDNIGWSAGEGEKLSLLSFVDWIGPEDAYEFDKDEVACLAERIAQQRLVWVSSPLRSTAKALAWEALERSGSQGRRLIAYRETLQATFDFRESGIGGLVSQYPGREEIRVVDLTPTNALILQGALRGSSQNDFEKLRADLAAQDLVYVFVSDNPIDPAIAGKTGSFLGFAVRTLHTMFAGGGFGADVLEQVKEIEDRIAAGELDEADLVGPALSAFEMGDVITWLEDVKTRQADTGSQLFRDRYVPEIKAAFADSEKGKLNRIALFLAGCFEGIAFEDFKLLGHRLLAGQTRSVRQLIASAQTGTDRQIVHEHTQLWSDAWVDEIDDICGEREIRMRPSIRLGMIASRSDFMAHIATKHAGFHGTAVAALSKAGVLFWKDDLVAERFADLYGMLMRDAPAPYIGSLLSLVDRTPLPAAGPVGGDPEDDELLQADRRPLERVADLLHRLSDLNLRPNLAAQCLRRALNSGNHRLFFHLTEVLARRGLANRLTWWNEYGGRQAATLLDDNKLTLVMDCLVTQSGSMAGLIELLADFEDYDPKKTAAATLIEQIWLAAILPGTWWSIGDDDNQTPARASLLGGVLALDDTRLRKLARRLANLDFGSGSVSPALKPDSGDIFASALALLAKHNIGDRDAGTILILPELAGAEVQAASSLAAVLVAWTAVPANGGAGDSSRSASGAWRVVRALVECMDRSQRVRFARGVEFVESWLDHTVRLAEIGRGREKDRLIAHFGLRRKRARELHALVVRPAGDRSKVA